MPTLAADAPAPPSPTTHVPVSALFADLADELVATRRLLERYPDAHADWRPHEKSMTLVTLACHVAEQPEFARVIVETAEWNAADTPYVPPTARTAAEILDLFDSSESRLRDVIATLDAPSLDVVWRMRNGDVEYFSGTRGSLLRRYLISHMAHHRGQLTVYYRLLGVPVPGMYGPTADEQ